MIFGTRAERPEELAVALLNRHDLPTKSFRYRIERPFTAQECHTQLDG